MTDKESTGSMLNMDCGGVMNGVYYTRPLMKLMIFEDRIVVKALFSTISINKENIISAKPQSGFFAKGLLLKYRESQTQTEKEIIVWTDFVSGEKHKEVFNLIVEKFTQINHDIH